MGFEVVCKHQFGSVLVFHLHVRYRSRDGGCSCESAREYISREGAYATRPDKVRWATSVHMPRWASEGTAANYWQAAEGRNSRANARTAILVEFALPKALPVDEQNTLAMTMAEKLSSFANESVDPRSRLPVTLALHEGHGRNPHIHALVSTSINDGVDRDELRWFRRFSPEVPESSGARRSAYVTKRGWLFGIREAWADLANAALVRVGLAPTFDHRSHATRGLRVEPDIHLGPRISHMARQGRHTARGARRAKIMQSNEEQLTLEASVLRRRQDIDVLEQQAARLEHDQRLLEISRNDDWREMLRLHPLAGDVSELRASAVAMVIESDLENVPRLYAAYSSHSSTKDFVHAFGRAWEVVPSAHGFWAIRPGENGAVMIGPGYAATDAGDEQAMIALIEGARLLPFSEPILVVSQRVEGLAKIQVGLAGLNWRVSLRNESRRTPKVVLR
jgi:hypothetical protein